MKRKLFTKKEREAILSAKFVEQAEAQTDWRDPTRRGVY